MALTFGFYNSMGGDRRYNATQVSELFDGLITDGVFHSVDDILTTVPGEGLQVILKSGKAWFNHTWNKNDAPIPFALAQPDMTLARLDALVLEVNSDPSVRANRFLIIKGTAATTPLRPVLTNTETLHQHPLAYIRVRGAATKIEQSDIEVVVGKNECPFVTGILTAASIEDLFQQWNGQFYDWWDTIKATLDENVVTNLQNQINARVKIADLATEQEVLEGVRNDKWMSPGRTKSMITENRELQIGDIQLSSKNLEAISNGSFLTCDGRNLATNSYPELYSNIKRRFGFTWGSFDVTAQHNVGSPGSYFQGLTSFAVSPDRKNAIVGVYDNHTGLNSIYARISLENNTVASIKRTTFIFGKPVMTFYIGNICYQVIVSGVYTSGNLKVYVCTIENDVVTTRYTGPQMYNETIRILGFKIINGVGYLTYSCSPASTATSSYIINILKINGFTISATVVKSDWTPNVLIHKRAFVLNRTLYMGANANQQTDIDLISLKPITNPDLINLLSEGYFVLGTNKEGTSVVIGGGEYIHVVSDLSGVISIKKYTIKNRSSSTDVTNTYRAVYLDDKTIYLIGQTGATVWFGRGGEGDDEISIFDYFKFSNSSYVKTEEDFTTGWDDLFLWSDPISGHNGQAANLRIQFHLNIENKNFFKIPKTFPLTYGPEAAFIKAKK